ncbi:MAG: hypothetical protein AAF385_08340 [Pseudomonadota bacterium]
MALLPDHGITVIESPDRNAAVSFEGSGCTAFLGRTLRGPLNTATVVGSACEFRRKYGGDLSDSNMAISVSQFFAHGGDEAIIVRLANNARSSVLTVPCPDGPLKLLARHPGASEVLRAAVDYDDIPAENTGNFNLSLQRLSGTKRMLDQEIHRNLSLAPDSPDYIESRLKASDIASCMPVLAQQRPMANSMGTNRAYYEDCLPGTDGGALSDYDFVGSARNSTGLFALDEVDALDFIYVPPEPDDSSPGPVLAAAAARYALLQQATLILDPPASGATADFYGRTPNILTYDRRPDMRMGPSRVPVGGALAGMLADAAKQRPPAAGLSASRKKLSRQFVLRDTELRPQAGLGLLPGKDRIEFVDRAAVCSELTDDRLNLADFRVLLHMQRQLLKTTGWCLFDKPGAELWQRLEHQVGDYLKALVENNCIEDQDWYVQCDAFTNTGCLLDKRQVRCLVSFRFRHSEQVRMFTLEQSTERASFTRSTFVRNN